MGCFLLITCFALLLGYVQKAFAMRVCDVIAILILFSHVFLLAVFAELGGGLMFFFCFFLSLVKRSCVVSVNSVSDAFSTN